MPIKQVRLSDVLANESARWLDRESPVSRQPMEPPLDEAISQGNDWLYNRNQKTREREKVGSSRSGAMVQTPSAAL